MNQQEKTQLHDVASHTHVATRRKHVSSGQVTAASPLMTTVLLLAAIVVVIFAVVYLLSSNGRTRETLLSPAMPAAGQPDAFGRPPGDPHYGHDHP